MTRTRERVFFSDLDPQTIMDLEALYFPHFSGSSDLKLADIYEIAQSKLNLMGLKETAIRTGMRQRYVTRQHSDFEPILLQRENSLDRQVHEFRRKKLIFEQEKRDFYDERMLRDSLIDILGSMEVKQRPLDLGHPDPLIAPTRVFISDLHTGKYEYSEHELILDKVVEHTLDNLDISKINNPVEIVFGGDMIDGLLRMSQIQKLKAGMVEQVKWAIELITNFLEDLGQYVDITHIYYIDESNHDQIRPLGSGRSDFPEDNLSKIVSMFIEELCDKKNIGFSTGRDLEIEISGETWVVTHGDRFRSKANMLKHYSGRKVIHGHFHNFMVEPNVVGLPALVYPDEYTAFIGIPDSVVRPSFVMEHNGFFKEIILK